MGGRWAKLVGGNKLLWIIAGSMLLARFWPSPGLGRCVFA